MQKRVVLKYYSFVVVLSIAVSIGLNNLLMLIDLARFSERYREATEILYAPAFARQILYSGILMPIVEEFLFRGLLFKVLRKWISFPWAMWISALVFGAYHGNLVQFVYATVCGLVLAFLYEKYETMFAPIISHITFNVTALIITEAGAFAWMLAHRGSAWICMTFCFIMGIYLLRQIQKVDVTKMLKIYCKDNGDKI